MTQANMYGAVRIVGDRDDPTIVAKSFLLEDEDNEKWEVKIDKHGKIKTKKIDHS